MRTAMASILLAAALGALAGCERKEVPNTPAMLSHQVDSARHRSWWLTRDGVELHSAAAPRRAIALPGWIWVDEPHCPPSLAIGPNGEAVVTSNVVPMLWRIDAESFTVTLHPVALAADTDKDVGFAALAWSAEYSMFLAYSDTQRSVWKIDPGLKGASKIANADLRQSSAECGGLAKRLNHFSTD